MKILKWLLVLAVIVAVIATAVHLRRDSIARDIANSILSEQGLLVSDLSVEALTANRLELAELIIVSENGTRYEIFGLALPVSVTGRSIERVTADRLVVTFAEDPTERTSLVETLDKAFALPGTRPPLDGRDTQLVDRLHIDTGPGQPVRLDQFADRD